MATAAPAVTAAADTAVAVGASAGPPPVLPTGPVGEVLQLAAAQLLDQKRSRLSATPTASAVGAWSPGEVISLFISNGTAERPNAGLLVGNGFSFTAGSCTDTAGCKGGNGGLLIGDGGAGFSGHGFMQGPAIGTCLAELILDGAATTVDISAFRPSRYAEGKLAPEHNVI